MTILFVAEFNVIQLKHLGKTQLIWIRPLCDKGPNISAELIVTSKADISVLDEFLTSTTNIVPIWNK